jgi:hypothetical protein
MTQVLAGSCKVVHVQDPVGSGLQQQSNKQHQPLHVTGNDSACTA